MSGLCIAAGVAMKALAVSAFTLSWTHSVERVTWQEDWRVTPAGLVLVQARVKGSGAGMEPGAGARLRGGWWQWRPDDPPRPVVILAQSGAAGHWHLCAGGKCRTLSDWADGHDADTYRLAPCARRKP